MVWRNRSKELFAKVGNSDGNQRTHHPFQKIQVSLDWSQFNLEAFLCDQFRPINRRAYGISQPFSLLLIEASLLELTEKFVGIKGN